MAKSLDSLAVRYLLDDDQPKLKALADATRILVGRVCPNGCDGREHVSLSNDGEGFCESCDEYFILSHEAERILHDAGIYVTLEVR